MVKLSSTEEENTEFLSSLWDRYKVLFLLGIVIFIASILGWETWKENQSIKYQNSSDLYQSFIESLDDPDKEEEIIAKKIIETYPESLYSDLVTLHLVKLNIEQNKLEEAEKQLKWILDKQISKWGKDFNPIEITVRLRLARVLISNGKPLEALEVINQSETMNGSLYEVKGDAEELIGEFSQAKISYLKALEETQSSSIQGLIRMKLADLGN